MTLKLRNNMPLLDLTNSLLVETIDLLEREDSKRLIITDAVLHPYNLNCIHLPLKGIIHSFQGQMFFFIVNAGGFKTTYSKLNTEDGNINVRCGILNVQCSELIINSTH